MSAIAKQETVLADGVSDSYSSLMYAIAFDLDTAKLDAHHPAKNSNKAYREIRDRLKKHGFTRQQESVYYGDESVNVVGTILAVQALSKSFPWFKPSVKDIRILQLMGNDDLKPLL